MKHFIVIVSLCAAFTLPPCDPAPLYGHVNTEGNRIHSDSSGQKLEEDMNASFCPPDQAPDTPC
jgi:hypothetical protein